MSHYEKDHYVRCEESELAVKSVIRDPNGNYLTFGELCDLINTLQDDVYTLKSAMDNIIVGCIDCNPQIKERLKLAVSSLSQP